MFKIFSKNLMYLFGLLFVLVPSVTFAHVKWFAESVEYVEPYKITDIPVIISICIVLFIIFLAIVLEKKLNVPSRINNILEKWSPYALSIASIGFGLAFLIFTFYGFVFAPNLIAEGDSGYLMLVIQGLVGLMFLFGFYEKLGGALLLVLFVLGVREYGAIEMLDTLEILGFAIYAIIVGRPKWKIKDTQIFNKLTHTIHDYGNPILRVGTGLNLMVLAFSEKILTPSLTNNFLQSHNWNFMEFLGMSDYWFAFSAGVAEFTFGILLVLGLVTRLTTIALAVFLVITLYLLGPIELVGHLPHFSIAIVLLILGSGKKLKLISK